MKISKQLLQLHANPKAVIALFLRLPGAERPRNLVNRVALLTEKEVSAALDKLMHEFGERHRDIKKIFLDHFSKINDQLDYSLSHFSDQRKLLLGAFFTKEYSIQSAALFNPSIVVHPDQQGTGPGEQRFVMSLRATGEGHISSIVFHTGILDQEGKIQMDIQKGLFTRLLHNQDGPNNIEDTDYDLGKSCGGPINEKVIFPSAKQEIMGMEDLRLVKFEDGAFACYYGTYTAYDGNRISSKLLETTDFKEFRIRTLFGAAISDKGMALFPEKINGKYAMISRQGGEKIQIMFSADLYRWENFQLLMEPKYEWELLQLGNCGAPLKTNRGWLLLIHGVGAMRKYVLSAILLSLDDPRQIIGRLDKPLLEADETEREGYVPNVVYTCGAMLHAERLIVPYAMSDSATGFFSLVLNDLLEEFKC
jgi:predicted GH43/DUF377 family glycosyl hydrolase